MKTPVQEESFIFTSPEEELKEISYEDNLSKNKFESPILKKKLN